MDDTEGLFTTIYSFIGLIFAGVSFGLWHSLWWAFVAGMLWPAFIGYLIVHGP